MHRPERPSARALALVTAGWAVARAGLLLSPAGASVSGHYTIEPDVLDAGGGASSSASYSVVASIDGAGPVAGAGPVSTHYAVRSGFPAVATGLARVVGRHLFYNASAFDGGTPGPDVRDDQAIATDKQALRPGGTAGFANYSSYTRGINGIFVDVEGWAGTNALAADFGVRVGNSDDHGNWPSGPTPSSVSIRPGAGVGGSTRVTLVWSDRAILKQWARIDVLPGGRSDLLDIDRFFFGNAVGETGDRPGVDALVDATDEVRTRQNTRSLLNPAPITFAFDFNRDRQVNATDQIETRVHATTAANALRLISPLATASGVPGGALAGPGSRGALGRGRALASSGQTAAATGLSGVLTEPASTGGLGGQTDSAFSNSSEGSPAPELFIGAAGDGSLWIVSAGNRAAEGRLEWSAGSPQGPWQPVEQGSTEPREDGGRVWWMPAASGGAGGFFRVVFESAEVAPR